MLPRRRFLLGATAVPWLAAGCARTTVERTSTVVNDVHSRLNATRVAGVATPRAAADLPAVVRQARRDGRAISVAGGRHAMGGQQFGEDTLLVDTRALQRVIGFDADRGRVEVECGIQWPELIAELRRRQADRRRQWGIVQKQTGADRLTIGGAVAANIHGRGLTLKPFVGDLESFTLVDATGEPRRCSRTENAELFRLAAGGYGLFGIVATAVLRLAPRRKLERVVEIIDMDGLSDAFERRIEQGFLFGDCQYATDATSADFLRRGVFSCYRPVDDARAMPPEQKELAAADWDRLLYLSHTDKRRAFETYAAYYVSTSGQLYWSDTTQLSVYLDDYHAALDRRLGASEPATEIITEIYVPRASLAAFLGDVRADFRRHRTDLIYGTVRLIERDDETMLAWAREPWACIIFNLHTVHNGDGLAQAADAFRRLIDLAIARGGSYFLTYHRFPTRRQVEACYPQFAEFLRRKRQHDPEERFQSEWYRHYRRMFANVL
jgi:FAD/FMN-containing dehydrogenase